MGISVSFYNKKKYSEDTHCCYSTMGSILSACGLENGCRQLRTEYYVELPAIASVVAMERFLRHFRGSSVYEKEVRYVKQILTQYHALRKNGIKPTKFGGA